MTAPAGKFKTFRAQVNKDALKEVTAAFLKDLVDRKPHDTFFVLQNAAVANLQPVARMNVNSGAPFMPTGQAPMAMKMSNAAPFTPSAAGQSSMSMQATPF